MNGMNADLLACLDRWAEFQTEDDERRLADMRHVFERANGALPYTIEEIERNQVELHAKWVAKARAVLPLLAEDNSHRTPEELQDLAAKLSPGGGAHTSGLLIRIILANIPFVDPTLAAATVYLNWAGGKAGFQFLPDPCDADPVEYQEEAWRLLDMFADAGGPAALLTGEDRAFYDSLPDRITVYRGAAGAPEDVLGSGLCWTTRRPVAEWFALRSASARKADPVVLTARVRKEEVALALAGECEIVVSPRKSRRILCRRRREGFRPAFEWVPSDDVRATA